VSLLTDVKRGVQSGNLSINEARAIIWDHEFEAGYNSAETWQSIAFLAAMVCMLVIAFGLELLLAWR
jgi:hypothetical protein